MNGAVTLMGNALEMLAELRRIVDAIADDMGPAPVDPDDELCGYRFLIGETCDRTRRLHRESGILDTFVPSGRYAA